MTGVVGHEGSRGVEMVVGVDTHQDEHVAVAIDRQGVRLGGLHTVATTHGDEELERWSRGLGEIHAFGIEGTGSYGAGVARFLTSRGYSVVKVNRPDRSTRYRKGKSDPTNAEMAARAVLAGVANATPKSGEGEVEMIRMLKSAKDSAVKARTQAVNQMKALVVTALPAELRETLLFHRPLEQGQGRDLSLGLATLRPDRLFGHELRPGDKRPLRCDSLLVVAVPVHRHGCVTVPVVVVTLARDRLDRRTDTACVVAVAVDPDGLRRHLDRPPALAHQQRLGFALDVPCRGKDLLHRLGLVLLVADDHSGQGHLGWIPYSIWPSPAVILRFLKRTRISKRSDMHSDSIEELERRLHAAMLNIGQETKKFGYSPVRFDQMVNDIGGLRTAQRLLGDQNISAGLTRLWEEDRLDLSMEALGLWELGHVVEPTRNEREPDTICPYCETEITSFDSHYSQAQAEVIVVVKCPNCHKILGMVSHSCDD